MRFTVFQELLHAEFGAARGDMLYTSHVLAAIGGRTGAQAVAEGSDPRAVWRALCAEFDVPRSHW